MLAAPTAPRLTGPTASEAKVTQPTEPKADPISSGPQPQPAKAKPPVNATLDSLGDVKPVSSEEILDDKIPW
jgi:hypothetical protein